MKEIIASAASMAVAGFSGMGAYYAAHACDQVEMAYNTCLSIAWSKTVRATKGPLALVMFELFGNALSFDGSKSCPSQFKNFNACKEKDYSGTLLLVSIASGIFSCYSIYKYGQASAIQKAKAL
ncbi:MAG: hypothetical protein H0X29_02750 [Parachlamydiaceae bacterium]|nr:hypothetical protein [Parachlamydiaceae bacterium]